MRMSGRRPKRVVIAGGGYSAVAFVCQWLSALRARGGSLAALAITVVEPREQLGAGVAYSTADIDHRINAPALGHMALAHNPSDFQDWFLAHGGLERDPDARRGEAYFPRRRVFAEYLAQLIRPFQASGQVRHWRDIVDVVQPSDANGPLMVRLRSGVQLPADLLVIATGHLPVQTPAFVTPAARAAEAWIAQPWRADALRALPRHARIMLLGTGLTAADVLATLARQGHGGAVLAVSRRGLRPQARPPPPPLGETPVSILERLRRPVPEFLHSADGRVTVRQLLRALRARIRRDVAQGRLWYEAFDDLRDALHRLWPQLSARDQRRFQRHLKPWYDTYRYRMPPQTGHVAATAEREGRLMTLAARVLLVNVDGPAGLIVKLQRRGSDLTTLERFDAVVNCTGPAHDQRLSPLLEGMLTSGMARVHASGIGLDVNRAAELVDRKGVANPRIRVIGPPAAGALGDSIGAVFICAHIERLVDELLRTS